VVEPNTDATDEERKTTIAVTSHDDSEDESHESQHHIQEPHRKLSGRELQIARGVIRKWWRLAGLKGTPNACDDMEEGEFQVDWTRVRLKGQSLLPIC
jgi:hypothetical protein